MVIAIARIKNLSLKNTLKSMLDELVLPEACQNPRVNKQLDCARSSVCVLCQSRVDSELKESLVFPRVGRVCLQRFHHLHLPTLLQLPYQVLCRRSISDRRRHHIARSPVRAACDAREAWCKGLLILHFALKPASNNCLVISSVDGH